MSDELRTQPFAVQLRRIVEEYEATGSIFGIHRSLFWDHREAPFATPDVYGRPLATPVGPSAGPHTQLSQNVVAAWLCGARFMELKTVQIMDELEIARPCIDMVDEGYNVEWSQELKLHESAREYVSAWALVHVLPRLLGWKGQGNLGTIFDMSVGYNLEGIRNPRMLRFMDTLANAAEELAPIREALRRDFPRFADVEIPDRIVSSVTLSTMHGCPPDEVERIAAFMLEERGLHTLVKLNPTLLGKEGVLEILHGKLGFREIDIPDSVFAHDMAWDKAVGLVRNLKKLAAGKGLVFGVKLSNTLAMRNHRQAMPGEEMYMSGRALYPVTINLFDRLSRTFDGDLRVSYSAGADAVNLPTILSCGALPVTVCSDLLKPGGYARLGQFLENLEAAMKARGAASLADLSRDRQANLRAAAEEALTDPRYKKAAFAGQPKVRSGLGPFDCIVAPCVEPCAVCQDVPEYAGAVARGEDGLALEVILARNPFPGVTGYVCTHLCQTRCTRADYDETVAIRALKRFAEEKGRVVAPRALRLPTGCKVAVIGGGPSGMSAAYFLALNGIEVDVFEARDALGGMTRLVPVFRLPGEVIARDVDRILGLGVRVHLEDPVRKRPEDLLKDGFDAVYVAAGFQRDTPLDVPGLDARGVHVALDLLDRTRRGERPDLGRKALVVGGGDTAMDATRTARRLTGNPTTIVYRRTRAEMPASPEELEGAFEEGNLLEELASPVRVLVEDGKVVGLECLRNRLGEPGPDGRRKPVPVPGSEFRIPADSVIVAVGQSPDLGFLEGSVVRLTRQGGVAVDTVSGRAAPGVFAGGDAAEAGPESIIAACAGGRRAAEGICRQLGLPFLPPPARVPVLSEAELAEVKRARTRKVAQVKPGQLPVASRGGFELIEATFTDEQARREGSRCLQCTSVCDKCVEVCPNRANQTFLMKPVRWELPRLEVRDGALVVAGTEVFEAAQGRQILNVNDFCNACGNCTTFCVHQGRPFHDKPRLFLNEPDFAAEEGNAYRIEGGALRRREGGHEARLSRADGHLVYETGEVRLRLTPGLVLLEATLKAPFAGVLSLRPAAEMAVVLEGVSSSLPHLLR